MKEAEIRRLSVREEELLGLLAAFPDGDGGSSGSDRELSFSDLVEAGACRPPSADADVEPDLGAQAAAPREDDRPAAASKKQRQQQAARQRAARRSGGCRGSCGGGGDGVLLNFYVPGLLTRSMTMPKPTRGLPSPRAVQSAPAKTVAAAAAGGKTSRTQTALGIGCWPALWGRSRRSAKACS